LRRSSRLSIVARHTPGEKHPVDNATAEIERDDTRRNAFTLLLDGVESSHVDLDDPTYLVFEYMQWFGGVVDCLRPAKEPVDTVHVGGAAATLARFIAATRPLSRQTVFEIDAALVELVREKLPLPKSRRLRIRVADARLGLAALPTSSADLVVRDAFLDAEVPPHLLTIEFALLVKETLRPGGVYMMNVADGVPFRKLGPDVAAVAEAFSELAVISEPAVFRGRRHGNLVVLASDAALPVDGIAAKLASGAAPARVRAGGEARAMARGHRPPRDQ
jgi:spermidine synthase